MKLRPVQRTDAPTYPTRMRADRAAARWLRRTAAALGLGAALLSPACTLGGVMFEPSYYFACSDGPREDVDASDTLRVGGEYSGTFCAEPEEAWGVLEVEEPCTAHIELIDDAQVAILHVADGAGEEIALLDPEEPAADVSLPAGRLSLVVEGVAVTAGYGDFQVSITDASETP